MAHCDSPADCTKADPCPACAGDREERMRVAYGRELIPLGGGDWVAVEARDKLSPTQAQAVYRAALALRDAAIECDTRLIQIGAFLNLRGEKDD